MRTIKNRGKILRAWNIAARTSVEFESLIKEMRGEIDRKKAVSLRRSLLELTSRISISLNASKTAEEAQESLSRAQSIIEKLSRELESVLDNSKIDEKPIRRLTNRLGEIQENILVEQRKHRISIE